VGPIYEKVAGKLTADMMMLEDLNQLQQRGLHAVTNTNIKNCNNHLITLGSHQL
jgi:hypothetical protein